MSDSLVELDGGASSAKTWTSAMIVRRLQLVVSPLDGELYRRKTADGSSPTDPADDIVNYFAASYIRTSSIVVPTGLVSGIQFINQFARNATSLSLAGVPAARSQILSMTGAGQFSYAAIAQNSGSAAKTRRIEIIVDGRTVIDSSESWDTSAIGKAYLGTVLPVAVGANTYSGYLAHPDPVEFRRSLVVMLTPSVAETSVASFFYMAKGNS